MANRYSIEAVFKAVDKMTGPVSAMQKRIGRFTSSVEKGLRSVRGAANRYASGAMTSFRAVGAVATVAFGAVSAALLSIAADLDTVAKTSRRIAFPIEDFQEWIFVAEQSGLTKPEFVKGIDGFNKRLGELRAQTGSMFTILKKTNPQLIKQLNAAKNSAEAFDIYIDALRRTESPQMRAALGAAAFGRTGMKLANITEQSAEAINALRLEQRENGVATMEQAAAAEALNDAVNSLKRAFVGFLQQALLPMAPILTDLARRSRVWMNANKEIVSERLVSFLNSVVTNFSEIVKWTKRIGIGVAVFVGFIAVLNTLIGVLTLVNLLMAANPITLIVLGVIAAIAAFTALVVWIDDVRDGLNSLPGPLKVLLAPLMALINGIKFVKDAFNGGLGYAADQFMAQFSGESGEESGQTGGQAPAMVSPAQRNAVAMNENRVVETFEAILRDETGRVETTRGGQKSPFRVVQTGAY